MDPPYWDLLHVTLVAEKLFSIAETFCFTHRMWVNAICTLIENDTRHHRGWNVEAQPIMITSRICRITNEIGRSEVLLPINHKNYNFREKKNSQLQVMRERENCNKRLTKNCCSGWMWLVDLNCNSECDYNIGLLNCPTTDSPIYNNLGGEFLN